MTKEGNDVFRLAWSVISMPVDEDESLVNPEANKDSGYYRILHLECAQLYAVSDQIGIRLEQSTELSALRDMRFKDFHNQVTRMMFNAEGLRHEMTKSEDGSKENVQAYYSRFIESVGIIDRLLGPFIENIALNYPAYYSLFGDFVIHFIRVRYITQHPSEVSVIKFGDREFIKGVGNNESRITKYPILI